MAYGGWAFSFLFHSIIFKGGKSSLPGSNSRPNVSEGYNVTSELPGRPACIGEMDSQEGFGDSKAKTLD